MELEDMIPINIIRENFSKEKLDSFRKLLDAVNDGFPCQQCGLCCTILNKEFLNIEVEEVVQKYGKEFFDDKTYPFPVLKKDDLFPRCLNDAVQARENLKDFEMRKHRYDPTEKIPLDNKARCKIYDKRFIICRLYPQYPVFGSCIARIKTNKLTKVQKRQLEAYMASYIYNIKREMIESQEFAWESWKPKKKPETVLLRTNKLSHFRSVTNTVTRYWNLWYYIDEIPVLGWQTRVVEQLNGGKSIYEISKSLDIEINLIINFLQDLLIFDLIEIPLEFQLPSKSTLKIGFI